MSVLNLDMGETYALDLTDDPTGPAIRLAVTRAPDRGDQPAWLLELQSNDDPDDPESEWCSGSGASLRELASRFTDLVMALRPQLDGMSLEIIYVEGLVSVELTSRPRPLFRLPAKPWADPLTVEWAAIGESRDGGPWTTIDFGRSATANEIGAVFKAFAVAIDELRDRGWSL